MRLERRVERFRGLLSARGVRAGFIDLVFVRPFGGRRVDVRVRWIGGGSCLIHTDHASARRAVAQVITVADHIRPGIRFKASDPTEFTTDESPGN